MSCVKLFVRSIFNHTTSGSTTTKEVSTVNDDAVYDEVKVQKVEMKENSAYDTALAAVSPQLLEQKGEETTHDYEDVSQL